MSNPNCIFCKIVKGDIPSYKIHEDDSFLTILDIYPNTKGMALVITKEHYGSYVSDMSEEMYTKFFLAAKRISKLMDDRLNVKRTAIVMEGMGINHAHIKLYPLHGLTSAFKEMVPKEKVFFNEYQGYITTQLGPQASDEDLIQIRNLFK